MIEEPLRFSVTNTTNAIVPVSFMGNNADPMDTANATTQYTWNVSSFVITTENTITLQYKPTNQVNFSIATTTFSGTTLQSVIDALNTLNLGYFFVTTSGATTLINNYNDDVTFSVLEIFDPTQSATLTYSWSFSGSSIQAEIYVNAVLQVSNVSPAFASGNVSVNTSDTILFVVTVGGNTKATNYFVYNLTTQTYIVNQTITNGVDVGYTFTIQANNSYLIGMQN
jgi:hypothetical protein